MDRLGTVVLNKQSELKIYKIVVFVIKCNKMEQLILITEQGQVSYLKSVPSVSMYVLILFCYFNAIYFKRKLKLLSKHLLIL